MAGLAFVLAPAIPAAGHPYVQGGEVPVDSLATVALDLAHGCDTEADGGGADTTEVALEVPDWLRVVEVADAEGWEVDLEPDDLAPEVVTWRATTGAQPSPVFELDVVARGESGQERYLGVYQACGDASVRWIGTPDEPADDPGVRVTLTEPDPERPPPVPDPASPDPASPDPASPDPSSDGPAAEAADEPADPLAADEPAGSEPDEDADTQVGTAAGADERTGPGAWVPVGLGGLGLLAVAALRARRRGAPPS